MKVLLIIQIFETHNDTGSDRHYYFAKKLVENGHEVEVITANIDYKNARKRHKKNFGSVVKEVDGIKIKYVPVYSKFRGSFLKRMLFFLTFFFSSIYSSIRSSKTNIVYCVSTPLTVGFLGSIISLIKRVPMVFEVTDVWPDAAIHTGVVKNRFIISLARSMELFCYKRSTKIICLSNGIMSNIANKGTSLKKTLLIPNGVDLSLFNQFDKSIDDIERIKKKYQIDNKFLAMYMGAHGAYNSLFTIIEAAKYLKEFKEIKIVFIGDGDEKEKLKKYAADNNLENVEFIGTVKRTDSVKLLRAANIFLLPNRKGSFFQGNLPNKLFDYLISARPILVSGYGETSDVINESRSGIVVDAEDAKAFSSSILDLYKTSGKNRIMMGNNGRDYVKENFDRYRQFLKLNEIFEEAIHKKNY